MIKDIERILNGIDRTETDKPDGGWWETSTGADFGESKLNAIRELFNAGPDELSAESFASWTEKAIECLDATIFNGDEFFDDAKRAMFVGYLLRWLRQLSTFPSDCGVCNGTGFITRDPDIGTDQECGHCGGSGKVAE